MIVKNDKNKIKTKIKYKELGRIIAINRIELKRLKSGFYS